MLLIFWLTFGVIGALLSDLDGAQGIDFVDRREPSDGLTAYRRKSRWCSPW